MHHVFVLPAEFVRDMVLASSGLLNKTIGGPSVKPYQPTGLWELATSGRGILPTYKQDHGSNYTAEACILLLNEQFLHLP